VLAHRPSEDADLGQPRLAVGNLQGLMKTAKAWLFVHVIRPFLSKGNFGDIQDCPVCGHLLQWYDSHGWLHLSDGDADCWGALGHGKGERIDQ
jgi:hypothetical protein